MKQNGKRWISLVLALCIVLSLLPAMSVPAAAAVEVSTQEQLHTALENSEDISLTGNIQLTGTWTPVSSYSGTLSGKGHTISGLQIGSGLEKQGLVQTLASGGKIEDLTIIGSVESSWDSNAGRVGAFAGVNNGTIEGCVFYGSVSQNQGDNQAVGGIAGLNEGTILRCANYGDISAISTGGTYNAVYVGGIAGSNHGAIENCTNHGIIFGAAKNSNTYVGDVWGSTSWQFNGGYVGGIAGDTNSANESNTNDGAVLGVDSSESLSFESVVPPTGITFSTPPTQEELQARLPSYVLLNTTGGARAAGKVTWEVSGYDSSASDATYIFTGNVTLPTYVTGSGDITASITVTIGQGGTLPHSHPVCGASCTGHDGTHENVTWTAWDGTSSLADGSYYLTSNIQAADDITISGAVNLCLNGYALDLNGHHIVVPTGSSLTLCDCGTAGKITGQSNTNAQQSGYGSVYVSGGSFTMYSGAISGNKTYSGGGVYVCNSGTFTMHGGTISNNTANAGGGVFVSNSSTFTMHGGTISGNTTTGNGSGVFVEGGGSFTMSGGSITGNETENSGGGVYVVGSGSFAMSGGTISGNTATSNGGGVYVVGNGSFTMSGAPTITGNTKTSADNNVYLHGNAVITIGGALTGSNTIGVTMQTADVFTKGWGTYMPNTQPDTCFTSENSVYQVARSSGGEAMLHQHSYQYKANDATITESCECGHSATATISVPELSYTYTGNALTPAEVDYSDNWQSGKNLTISYSNNTNVGTATASITAGTATAKVSFAITAKPYDSTIAIDPIGDQTYTGSAIEPKPVIKDGDKTLTEGTDYTLSYTNNTDKGTGTVTVTFIGNYSGTADETFNIVYATLTGDTTNDTVFKDYTNAGDWSNSDKVTFETQDGWTVNTSPDGTYTGSVNFDVSGKADGSHTETVFVKDEDDNIYKTEITYKLDKTQPTVTDVEKPAADAAWTKDNVTVSFDASDATSDIAKVTVEKPDGTTETLTGSGKYTFTASENGTYTVTVTDKAGNTTVETIEIINIDKTVPGLTVTGGMVSAASLTLEAEAQQNGNSPVTVTAKDSSGNVLTANEDGTYTITKSGTYTFTATTGAGVTTTDTKTVHRITLDRDNDTDNVTELVVDGGKVKEPADPQKTGYTFARWMNGDGEWNFETAVTNNLTLTAAWTLDKPTVELTADKTEAIYGQTITLTAEVSHAAGDSISAYTYEWYKGDGKLDGETGDTLTLTDVDQSGSYTVKVTASDGMLTSAQATSNAVSVTIGKANPVQAWPTASDITYGQSLRDSNLAGGSAVDGSFAWEDDTVYPESGTRSYTVVFIPDDPDNYDTVTQAVTVTVNQAILEPSVSANDKIYDGDTAATGTVTLDGAMFDQKPTATGTFTFENENAGNNKTVTVTVTLDGDWGANYQLSAATLETRADIEKRTVGLTWSGYAGLVYDGEPVDVTATATGLVTGDECTVIVSGGDEINAGTYTARATGLENNNYQLPTTGITQAYTIAERPVELRWSQNSFSYDGTVKTVTAEVANKVGDDEFHLTCTGSTGTAAGGYTATVTGLGNHNYTLEGGENLSCDWSIARAVVSFTVGDNTHTYDGTAKTAAVAQTAGETQIPAGGYTVAYGGAASQTQVGTYDITVAISNPNFCLEGEVTSKVVGQLTIEKARVAIPDGDDTAFTYNGRNQTYEIVGNDLYTIDGNVEKNAGEYTVTVTLKDTDNYTWSDGSSEAKTYDFTIAQKPITGTWQGLHQVYDGEPQEVSILLTGLESVDQGISAVIAAEDGDMTTAGSHTLHAELDNYAITPATATLVIQKQPVVVNVTDNVVTPGGEPEIKVPNLQDHDYDVIYKDKDGNEVADLTESGTYEVWVKFPEDGNYRHPDGSTEAPVGSVTVSETQPTLYTVSFDGDEATGGSMAPLELAGGSTLTLPQCGYTKTGFQFTGWLYGTTTYRPGDRVTTVYGDMTFTAQWQETTGSVSGLVDEDQRPVEGAVVSLWLGANQVAETNTDGNGRYTFTDLLPGIYNLVVSHGQKTVTSMVEIDGGNETRNFSLPEGITNSVVEVTPGSPDLVVGNLDEIFNNTDGEDYTEEDAATVVNGGKVEITFNADEKQETEVQDDLEKLQSAGGSNLSLFLDCTLTKTVTDETGITTTELSLSSELLEVRLPLPTELQGKYDYIVSRIHEGEAQTLTTTANAVGEYFEVNADKTVLTLHVRCFSTYAVGYRNAPSAPTYPPEKEESENGSYTVSPSRPGKGDTVTITPKPDEGYMVDGVTVIDQNGDPVDVEKNDDGTYSFTQPGGSVTITVTFRPGAAYDGCPRDKTCPMTAFPDLVTTAWYHDGVHYCLDEGIMEGHSNGTFGPNGTLTRAQLVQILWNLEGRPDSAGDSFSDVAASAWYSGAVTWANGHGIVTGYGDGTFGPGDPITREQLAAILWRYAVYKGYDVSVGEDTNILSYADAFNISEYAVPAFQWACGSGIIEGVTDSTLVPGGTATRAQAATMLMRFCMTDQAS